MEHLPGLLWSPTFVFEYGMDFPFLHTHKTAKNTTYRTHANIQTDKTDIFFRKSIYTAYLISLKNLNQHYVQGLSLKLLTTERTWSSLISYEINNFAIVWNNIFQKDFMFLHNKQTSIPCNLTWPLRFPFTNAKFSYE